MKICDFCKNEINDDAKFCPVCGAQQKTEPVNNDPFGATPVETMPFGSAEPQPQAVPVQNTQPVNTYFVPPASSDAEMFNGGMPVQNVGAPKKKGKGGKVVLIIIGIIALIVIGLIVLGALAGGDSDVSDPSAGTSQNAGGKTVFKHGTVDESGYTNESLGIRINNPDGWDIPTSDEMSEFLEIYPNEEGKFIDVDGVAYEFLTINMDTGANIIVSSMDGNIADALLSEDDYINGLASDYNGVNERASAPFEKTIGSRTYKCIDADSWVDGDKVAQRIIVAKEGKQYFCVILTIFPDYDDVTLDELTDNYLTNN